MQELEKILEEIKRVENEYINEEHEMMFKLGAACIVSEIKDIIRKHMNDNPCGDCSRKKWYQVGYKDGKNDNNGWIPVEERLPTREECEKSNNKFFVQTENGENFCCEYDTLANGYDDPLWSCNVPIIAWHPLPEKYC